MLGSSRVVKFFEMPVDNWDGWTRSPPVFPIFSLTCEAFLPAAMPSSPIRERLTRNSNTCEFLLITVFSVSYYPTGLAGC